MSISKLLRLPKSSLLEDAAPKIKSILSSYPPPHHLPILTQSQRSRIERQTSSSSLPPRKAAVLLPILDLSSSSSSSSSLSSTFSNPSILLTLRSRSLNQHANQICFPGGHYDPTLDGDSLVNTALREAREELFSPPPSSSSSLSDTNNHNNHHCDWSNEIDILGRTSSVPSATGVPVTPYLACLPRTFPNNHHNETTDRFHRFFPGNPQEVSRVFTVSLSELLERESSAPLERLGTVGPVFDTDYGRIWGLTAIVLRPVLHKVLKPVFFGERNESVVR